MTPPRAKAVRPTRRELLRELEQQRIDEAFCRAVGALIQQELARVEIREIEEGQDNEQG